jgi:hypothetical protein
MNGWVRLREAEIRRRPLLTQGVCKLVIHVFQGFGED